MSPAQKMSTTTKINKLRESVAELTHNHLQSVRIILEELRNSKKELEKTKSDLQKLKKLSHVPSVLALTLLLLIVISYFF
jgi:DNA repair exonuclease SbcCD ATPase subunit